MISGSQRYGFSGGVPERSMWQQVIIVALQDALKPGADDDVALTTYSARLWFRSAGPDFQLVCELAGIDASAVAQAYQTQSIHMTALANKLRKGQR